MTQKKEVLANSSVWSRIFITFFTVLERTLFEIVTHLKDPILLLYIDIFSDNILNFTFLLF